MSDFFGNILQKTLNPSGLLAPRLPSRFETPSVTEMLQATDSPVPAPRTASPAVVSVREDGGAAQPARTIAPLSEIQPVSRVSSVQITSPVSLLSEQLASQKAPAYTPQAVVSKNAPVAPHGDIFSILTQPEISKLSKSIPENQPARLPEVPRKEVAPEERAARVPVMLRPADQFQARNDTNTVPRAETPPQSSRLQPVALPQSNFSTRREQRASNQSELTLVQPAPTVKISIGRIEVKAVRPPAAPPAPVKTVSPPKLTLDDYLKQRDEGKR